jgi:hypothetical protein
VANRNLGPPFVNPIEHAEVETDPWFADSSYNLQHKIIEFGAQKSSTGLAYGRRSKSRNGVYLSLQILGLGFEKYGRDFRVPLTTDLEAGGL